MAPDLHQPERARVPCWNNHRRPRAGSRGPNSNQQADTVHHRHAPQVPRLPLHPLHPLRSTPPLPESHPLILPTMLSSLFGRVNSLISIFSALTLSSARLLLADFIITCHRNLVEGADATATRPARLVL